MMPSAPSRLLPSSPPSLTATTLGGCVQFQQVSLFKKNHPLVQNIDFELKQAEILCLLGPSGCGKTSLLRLAAGIERPQSGTIMIHEQVVASRQYFVAPEHRDVSLMFQDFALFPHLSILQNVMFGLKRMSRKEAEHEAYKALERVGMAGFASHSPLTLSGGEQQRVALARAMAPRPAVLLMDEPFSGLDQRLRDHVRRETLELLKQTRSSCIIVTHDPAEALGMADRILLMRKGRLIQSGSPRQLYHHPIDVEAARFFSDFNELQGHINAQHVTTALGTFNAPAPLNTGKGLVLVRPQALRLCASSEAGYDGLVLLQRFEGTFTQLQIKFPQLEHQPLWAQVPTELAPMVGAQARFNIDPTQVLIFAQP